MYPVSPLLLTTSLTQDRQIQGGASPCHPVLCPVSPVGQGRRRGDTRPTHPAKSIHPVKAPAAPCFPDTRRTDRGRSFTLSPCFCPVAARQGGNESRNPPYLLVLAASRSRLPVRERRNPSILFGLSLTIFTLLGLLRLRGHTEHHYLSPRGTITDRRIVLH